MNTNKISNTHIQHMEDKFNIQNLIIKPISIKECRKSDKARGLPVSKRCNETWYLVKNKQVNGKSKPDYNVACKAEINFFILIDSTGEEQITHFIHEEMNQPDKELMAFKDAIDSGWDWENDSRIENWLDIPILKEKTLFDAFRFFHNYIKGNQAIFKAHRNLGRLLKELKKLDSDNPRI